MNCRCARTGPVECEPMTDPLLDLMVAAAIAASDVINEVYARPFEAMRKLDGSPVTEADQRAEAAILRLLAPTGIPVLAEESVAAGRIPALGERYFCVDPLDGTREFLKRNGEFTVNIALIEYGRSVKGVVLVPPTGVGYVGSADGAFKFRLADGVVTDRHPIHVDPEGPVRVVASRSHGHGALAGLCHALDVVADVSVGSSLKFCLVAEGFAMLYPRFTPTCEWDTAAGQAVLEAAGGAMVTLEGDDFLYGKQTSGFYNPYFAAAATRPLAERVAAEMRTLLRQ